MKKIYLFLILLAMSSCQIVKTNYAGGYKIKWNKQSDIVANKKSKNDKIKQEEIIVVGNEDEAIAWTNDYEVVNENNKISSKKEATTDGLQQQTDGDLVDNSHKVTTYRSRPILREDVGFSSAQKIDDIIEEGVRIDDGILSENSSNAEVHWGAIVGFISSILGLFVAGIIFCTLGVIFSSIALSKIRNNPENYKGSGLAIAGLVIGLVGLILTLIVISALA